MPPSPADSGVSDVDPSSSSHNSDDERIHIRQQRNSGKYDKGYQIYFSNDIILFRYTTYTKMYDWNRKCLYLNVVLSFIFEVVCHIRAGHVWLNFSPRSNYKQTQALVLLAT